MFLAAAGPGKCLINHGGCWNETRNGKTFSACQVGLELIKGPFAFSHFGGIKIYLIN